MRSALAIVSFAASLASALTLPRDNSKSAVALKDEGDVHTEAITHVYLCQGPGYGAPCSLESLYTGYCYYFINGYDNTISSAQPDPGTTCAIFDDAACGGTYLSFTYPGISDLSAYGWNDRASSIACF
ncbi:hypothetical protein F5B22DRAFT_661040 [Xylaria bambusicola]|uniref:uncharacterized protein n=1 Tax=Xylaria bambusicola TaxID=326684 RepID=UPI00200777E8|nr:uncharacterized protein F5B22DRAFT_661040 [Xylaria bambusicola]KAI0505727.1 hypothetical protein F5B22DRAFT_661040 [Xylaria bambusicola]